MTAEEQLIEWGDGSTWTVSWMQEFECFHAQRWFAEDFGLEAPNGVEPLECPGPEEGLFVSLDALEAAMGTRIPPSVRASLQDWSRHRATDEQKEDWGTMFPSEVHRVGPDGHLTSSFAPSWAEDPSSPEWDPEE